jgi:hypothetical protein
MGCACRAVLPEKRRNLECEQMSCAALCMSGVRGEGDVSLVRATSVFDYRAVVGACDRGE